MENMVITTPTLTRRQTKELTNGAANFMKMWCKPLIKMKAVGSVGERMQNVSLMVMTNNQIVFFAFS